MPMRRPHELYWSKIVNKEENYLNTAKVILELLKEGFQRYGNGNRYRFSLNEIMRRLDASIKMSKINAGRVVHTLLTKKGIKYQSCCAGHRKYEIILDRKKIEELEEECKSLFS